MRSTFRWIITLILIGSVVYYLTVMTELDLEQFYKWEIMVTVVLSIVIWLILQWRKTMRLKKTNVLIQLLDE